MIEEQKEVENQLKEEGWDIIQPTLIRDTSKCKHDWEFVGNNEYQCKHCFKGHAGNL